MPTWQVKLQSDGSLPRNKSPTLETILDAHSICRLPDEILLAILSNHVLGPEDWSQTRQVSRRLKSLTDKVSAQYLEIDYTSRGTYCSHKDSDVSQVKRIKRLTVMSELDSLGKCSCCCPHPASGMHRKETHHRILSSIIGKRPVENCTICYTGYIEPGVRSSKHPWTDCHLRQISPGSEGSGPLLQCVKDDIGKYVHWRLMVPRGPASRGMHSELSSILVKRGHSAFHEPLSDSTPSLQIIGGSAAAKDRIQRTIGTMLSAGTCMKAQPCMLMWLNDPDPKSHRFSGMDKSEQIYALKTISGMYLKARAKTVTSADPPWMGYNGSVVTFLVTSRGSLIHRQIMERLDGL